MSAATAARDVADYVVVGAGSAGSVVAARLAAAGASVILVEAGGTDRRPDVSVPVGVATVNVSANWRYPIAPDPSTGRGPDALPAGRIVGGGGSVNAMVHVRGRRSDYDGWADAGCPGWSYDEVLPHFRAMESWVGGADEYRGAHGPVAVSWCGHDHEIDRAFVAAAREAGHEENPDHNGDHQLGVSRSQVSQHRGRRSTSASTMLRGLPRDRRPRLLRRTTATRLVLEAGRAVAVDCGGRVLSAREEVVLATGAIGTPALLMRSGIGPGGASVNLPGVGANLQDHLVVPQRWTSRIPTLNTIGPLGAARALASYVAHGTGPLTLSPFEAELFTDDHQIAVTPMHYRLDRVHGRTTVERVDGFTVWTVLLHPRGRGRVRLHGGRPRIEHQRLADGDDRKSLLEGCAVARDLVESQLAMAAVAGVRLAEGDETDVEVDDPRWLQQRETSIFHPAGTCRMGLDDGAVVDPDLRVRGVAGLRVVDASVMPTLPSGNPNAATTMIADRAADLLLHGASRTERHHR